MARSVQNHASHQNNRKAPVRRKKKSRSLTTNIALGVGLTVATLVGASMITVATSVKSASQVRFETALVAPLPATLRPVTVAATGRDLEISKFSRLQGSYQADAKSGRLAGAAFAALSARRPDAGSVRDGLSAALSAANRQAESEQQFAALEKLRPDADAIKSILGPAMASLVVVAPRNGDEAMPDLLQDVQPATQVADLKNMQPVEMASLEEGTDSDDGDDQLEIAEDNVPVPSPAPDALIADQAGPEQSLPKAGPMPVFRPQTAVAALKPDAAAKPSALAAIAAVAPQKPGKSDDGDKPTVLAFAKPDNPMRDDAPSKPLQSSPSWPGIGTKVAVYDISKGVVHLPNGTTLEAHSGIGNMRDNPDFTHVKMRGPTPPGTYKLSMRESLFHGVAAIRLTPVDGKAPQGRTGLLAHSFLLRVRGDSHGCVAFAEYDKFLKAFQSGQVTHMVIVPRWDGKRPGRGTNGGFLAKLFGSNDA